MRYDYRKYYKKTTIDVKKDQRDIAEAKMVDKTIFGILIAIIAILPLLTRTKIIDFTSPLISNSSIGSGTVGDVFTYYKFIFLIISTVVLLLLFLYRTFGIGIPIKKSFINIPLAILAMFVTLSALFAPYKSLALVGIYNRHEGAITYLCYFTLFFIAANLTYTKKMLHKVIYALYPFTIVNVVLGLLGFYGIELVNNNFVRAILLPSGLTEENIGEGSRFITTINHGNYVSGISAVLLVIFMMMFILDKNKIRQAINGIMAILSFAMLLSSLSRSGFLTIVIMIPILVILLTRTNEKLKRYSKMLVQLVAFAVVFVIMANHNPSVWDESMGMFIAENPFVNKDQAIETINDKAYAIDIDQALATTNESNGKNSFNELHLNNGTILNEEILHEYKTFAKDQLDNMLFVSKVYAETTNESTESFQLPQLPESGVGPGSGRLFIWKNTFELVKQRPLTGYGLDTFIYHFPQNDPEKIANLETHKVIVDKPHNLYINILYGAGAIALLALLTLLVITFIKAVKTIMTKKLHDEQAILFNSLFVGWLAYLVQALFNDSIIGTAPVFWILYGVSIVLLINGYTFNKIN